MLRISFHTGYVQLDLSNYCTFANLLSFQGIEEAALVKDEILSSLVLYACYEWLHPGPLTSGVHVVCGNAIRVHSNAFRP